MNSEAAETLRRTSPPEIQEGAFALLLSADPKENRHGKLLLDGTEIPSRLLPCGVPADLAQTIRDSTPGQSVVLSRLPASEWKL